MTVSLYPCRIFMKPECYTKCKNGVDMISTHNGWCYMYLEAFDIRRRGKMF